MNYSLLKRGMINKNEKLFLIGYFLFIINQVFAQSQLSNFYLISEVLRLVRWGLIIFFIILVIVKNKYPGTKNGFFWLSFVTVAFIEMIFFDGKLLLLMLIIFVVCSYKYSTERIIKTHIKALIFGDLFIISLSIIGLLNSGEKTKEFDNLTGFMFRNNNITHSFGFIASNVVPITFLFVYLFVVFLKREQYNKYYDILVLVVDFGLYMLFGSRSAFILVIIAVLLRVILSKFKKVFLKIGNPICYAIFAVALFFSIFLPMVSRNEIINKIDVMLTARITIMRNALELYPMTLWGYGESYGKNIEGYLVLDNGYISLFVQRGIIIGVIFMAIIIKLLRIVKKYNDGYLLLIIIVWLIGNIIDATFLHYVSFPIYAIVFNIDWASKEKIRQTHSN